MFGEPNMKKTRRVRSHQAVIKHLLLEVDEDVLASTNMDMLRKCCTAPFVAVRQIPVRRQPGLFAVVALLL